MPTMTTRTASTAARTDASTGPDGRADRRVRSTPSRGLRSMPMRCQGSPATRASTVPVEPSGCAPERGLVRLTRRGQVVVVGLLLGLITAAFVLGRSAPSTAGPIGVAPAISATTVASGETLWAVANRIAPDRDPRDVVAQIRQLNRMGAAQLQVGQQLLLPAA